MDGCFLTASGRQSTFSMNPEALYNKRVTSQSESNTTATYMLWGKIILVSKQGI